MRTLYDGEWVVDYHQCYVLSDPTSGPDGAFLGQVNGLCGAAQPGALHLTTGRQHGEIDLTVELHDDEPPLDDGWEDVVEVSFQPVGPQVYLAAWDIRNREPLDLPEREYRVRYSTSGSDAAANYDTTPDGEPVRDRYLLQFWPGAAGPDRIVRQVTRFGAHFNEEFGTPSRQDSSPVVTHPDGVSGTRER